jgi:hypothetical protein
MTMAVRFVLLVGFPGLLASTGSGPLQDPDWSVYLRRVGPLRIGMSIDQVRRELGDPDAVLIQALGQTGELPRQPDSSPCGYMVSPAIPNQIGLMFQRGYLVRVDVTEPGIYTASGAQVGDAERRILELYGGRIQVTQHRYPPAGAHYMVFRPIDPVDLEYRMLFETDGATVTRFRTGTAAAVAQVEGCA